MNPWLALALGYVLGSAVVILVVWWGGKLAAYRGRHVGQSYDPTNDRFRGSKTFTTKEVREFLAERGYQ